jgi:predicted permease/ABC-type uncharacterized transport system substrate-binding protein
MDSRYWPLLRIMLLLTACLMPLGAQAKQGQTKPVRNVALILFKGESGVEKSFRETLTRSDFAFHYATFDAGGSIARVRKNLENLDVSKYDLIYTSGTPATEAALPLIKGRPVVFTLDVAPDASLQKIRSSSRNATGAFGAVSPETGFGPLSRIVRLRKLGIIRYLPAAAHPDFDLEKAQQRFGIRFCDLPVSESDSVPAVLKRVANARVDAVLFPSGTVTATNAEAIMAGLTKRGTPSTAVTGESVRCQHALLCLLPDSAELGRRAAQNALALLRGSRPEQVPWQSVGSAVMTVDLRVADRLGINLPLQVAALCQGQKLTVTPASPLASISKSELLIMLRALACMVLIVTVGVVIGRWDDWLHQQALIKLNDCIFLPCLIFFALHRHTFDLGELAQMGVAVTAVVSTLGFIVLSLNGLKSLPRERLVAVASMTSGTVLLPLAYLIFGDEGLAKAVYFHLLVLFLYHAFGSWSGNTHLTLKAFLKIPSLYVAAVAIILGAAPQPAPGGLQEFAWLSEKGVEMTGMGAIPLLLLSFGYPLGQLRFSTIRLGLAGGWLRMVVSPALALAAVLLLRSSGWLPGGDLLSDPGLRTSEAILILGAAMPTSHYALRLGIPGRYPRGDRESGTILLTAVGAVFTVGMVLMLIAAYVLR